MIWRLIAVPRSYISGDVFSFSMSLRVESANCMRSGCSGSAMTSCSSRTIPATKRSTMYWSTKPGVYFDASPNFSRISTWFPVINRSTPLSASSNRAWYWSPEVISSSTSPAKGERLIFSSSPSRVRVRNRATSSSWIIVSTRGTIAQIPRAVRSLLAGAASQVPAALAMFTRARRGITFSGVRKFSSTKRPRLSPMRSLLFGMIAVCEIGNPRG